MQITLRKNKLTAPSNVIVLYGASDSGKTYSLHELSLGFDKGKTQHLISGDRRSGFLTRSHPEMTPYHSNDHEYQICNIERALSNLYHKEVDAELETFFRDRLGEVVRMDLVHTVTSDPSEEIALRKELLGGLGLNFHTSKGVSRRWWEIPLEMVALTNIVLSACLLFQKEESGYFLIDDIESHLSVKTRRTLLPYLQKHFPHINFVVTTKDPIILAASPVGSVFVLEGKKPATIRRLLRSYDPPKQITEDLSALSLDDLFERFG